ncbi:MAG: Kae1-associated kinase Bud32 [Euryarchaeota archaeon]|jgi:Kae1-associated kinase Bud32|nr:Kae1-associated kinase Bud32 [Euryarchaeota archaeon]HJL54426.1 KEOPS complex kinase/ATPase Bud32 [Candidatus Thalassarchaeaceae archaeon]
MAIEAIPMWIPHGVLHEGAEATVTAGSWLGRPAVLKTRRARGYRHPDLDRRLTRQRLTSEARILGRLHELGFPAPALIDLDQGEAWILMSRIEGRPLYESLKDGSSGIGSLEHLGRIIRSLHEAGFSHGDLTTHNVIVSHDWQVHLIDFGLARQSPELEHLGLDLQVLKECLTASHSSLEGAVDAVVRGYLDGDSAPSETESASRVIERFQKITGRVRYHG